MTRWNPYMMLVRHGVVVFLLLMMLSMMTTVAGASSFARHDHRRAEAIASIVEGYKTTSSYTNDRENNYNKNNGGSSPLQKSKKHTTLEHRGIKPPTTTTSSSNQHVGDGTNRKICGMYEPTREKILHDNKIVQKYIEDRTNKSGRRKVQQQQEDDNILVVPTCFHIIRPENNDTYTDDTTFLNAEMIQLQLDGLNAGFTSASCCDPTTYDWCNEIPVEEQCSLDTNIQFQLATLDPNDVNGVIAGALVDSANSTNACITRTYNSTWYNADALDINDVEMRYMLRRGNANVLNIFFKGGLTGLLGIAQFPSDYAATSITDATIVNDAFVIGSSIDPRYGEGVSISIF